MGASVISQNIIWSSRKSRKVVHKFEMVRLSVSLFQLRLVIFPVSLLIFRIELVMSHEDTAGTPLDFLTSKILTELSLDEYRPMGKSIWFVSRHLPNTSEHPTRQGVPEPQKML